MPIPPPPPEVFTIEGGEGDDLLSGDFYEPNVISGFGGDDTIHGGAFGDTIDGGDGDDVIYGRGGGDIILGGNGDDIFYASGEGRIDGGAGVDTIVASDSRLGFVENVEVLEYGVDDLSANAAVLESFDSIVLSEGYTKDYVTILSSGNLDLSDELGTLAIHYMNFDGFGLFVSGDGDDSLFGGSLDGRGGHDTLVGAGTLIGGAGNDSIAGFGLLDGGDGDDTIRNREDGDTVIGGAGDDDIVVVFERLTVDAGSGDDIVRVESYATFLELDGGAGLDTFRASQMDLSQTSLKNFEILETVGTVRLTIAQAESFDSISGSSTGAAARLELAEAGTLDLSDALGTGAGFIVGSSGDDVITTGGGDDVLNGGAGDDVLNAGAGADRLIAGAGSDDLFGGSGDDEFVVSGVNSGLLDGGADHDTLFAENVDFSGARITGVETLDVGAGETTGTADQFEAFERIVSSDDDGIDLKLARRGDLDLSGQLRGRDAHVVGSESDDAIRLSYGDDTIDGGLGADRLNGADGSDLLLGGDGDDTLIGSGGKDTLVGDDGDDLYIVADAGDVVREVRSGSIDSVKSSIDYELTARVENLRLVGAQDLDGAGNGLANLVVGNRGDNDLDGMGGADTLKGGAGDDDFLFTTGIGKKSADLILDFGDGGDRIVLDREVFVGLAEGKLKSGAFKDISTGEVDAGDRILYDAESGKLFYDSDGSGSAKARLFATLDGAPDLTAKDFLIV